DAALPGLLVVPGEQRDHDQALHGAAEVAADEGGQPVRLALQRQGPALKLLVVLELKLEQPDELEPDPGHAGDADAGVVVAAEHLLDVPLRDQVAGGGPAGAGPRAPPPRRAPRPPGSL